MLRWAREDIENLQACSEEFFASQPYAVFHEPDPDSGNLFIKLRITDVPDEIRKLASHALWDIKHSLDHATCAAARVFRGDEIGDLHFPIASHPTDLKRKLLHIPKGETTPRYPTELHTTFEGFEPYPTGDSYTGGGDEFVALSKLANTTKHAIPLESRPRAHLAGAAGTGHIIKLYLDWWDSPNQELTIGLVGPEPEYNMNIQVANYIGFRDVPALEGYPATDVLTAYDRCRLGGRRVVRRGSSNAPLWVRKV